jgi:hypothetical protein
MVAAALALMSTASSAEQKYSPVTNNTPEDCAQLDSEVQEECRIYGVKDTLKIQRELKRLLRRKYSPLPPRTITFYELLHGQCAYGNPEKPGHQKICAATDKLAKRLYAHGYCVYGHGTVGRYSKHLGKYGQHCRHEELKPQETEDVEDFELCTVKGHLDVCAKSHGHR